MRPGLFGWGKEKVEVLELLAFWKPEQQAAHRFRIWRPLASASSLYKNHPLPAIFSLKILKTPNSFLLKKFCKNSKIGNIVIKGGEEKMEEIFKNLKVGKKFRYAFGIILLLFVVTILVAVIASEIIQHDFKVFYKESYQNSMTQMEIRKDLQVVGKMVLWSMTTEDEAEGEFYLESAEEYAQSVATHVEKLKQGFQNSTLLQQLDRAMEEMKTYRTELTELATANRNQEALELFNGAYNTATENIQNILITIGEELDNSAEKRYKEANLTGIISLIFMLTVGAGSIIFALRLGAVLTRIFKEPIQEIEQATYQLRNGDLNIQIEYQSEDELGGLIKNFRDACGGLHEIIQDAGELLSEMAEGNFNVKTEKEEKYVGEFVRLVESMRKLNRQLDATLRRINEASEQVALGAGQLAESAQSLAEGATDQAGAVEELTATIESVSAMAEQSAEAAQNEADRILQAKEDAEKSREELKVLTEAMERINATSMEIQNIIGAIEDIASQTNLLSLNASIEAARAGEAGRGFAVVADQIGKLASDSAQSAVDTRELIEKSIVEIEHGNVITEKTVKVLEGILGSMGTFAETATESSVASVSQAKMLKEVEVGIEQIAAVVESNSASAEQTSATSEELSAQSDNLKGLVGQFQLRQIQE